MKASILLLAVLFVSASATTGNALMPRQSPSNFSQFMLGVFQGFQNNPNSPTLCVLDLYDVGDQFIVMITYFESILSNYVYIFQMLNQFADFMDSFDSTTRSCQFSLLVGQIGALLTFQGRAALLARIAIKSQSIIQNWQIFYTSLTSGAYQASGVGLGNIFSDILNFTV